MTHRNTRSYEMFLINLGQLGLYHNTCLQTIACVIASASDMLRMIETNDMDWIGFHMRVLKTKIQPHINSLMTKIYLCFFVKDIKYFAHCIYKFVNGEIIESSPHWALIMFVPNLRIECKFLDYVKRWTQLNGIITLSAFPLFHSLPVKWWFLWFMWSQTGICNINILQQYWESFQW